MNSPIRPGFNTAEELIEEIREGRMVILVDDEDRENEGDLVLAADHVNSAAINFMALQARGLICLSLSPQQIERLQLPLMVRDEQNFSSNKTAFTVSIEAAAGVSTGISASDRAHTIRVASNPAAKPSDVHMPGHIFPIRAKEGGVLKRAGHTEGSVDLATLAGLNPAAVICEVMNDDGSMARVPDLRKFALKHGLKIGTIVDLIEYRLSRDHLVEEVYSKESPLLNGFRARVFKSKIDGAEHLVLQKGEISRDRPVTVRVQLDSYVKDVISTLRFSQSPVERILSKLSQEESAIFLLLRGNNPIQAQSELKSLLGEAAPKSMDQRDYGIGAQILRLMGAHKIRLVSNTVDKKVGLKAYDIEIVEIVTMTETVNEELNQKLNQEQQHGKEDSTEEDSANNLKENQSVKNRSGHITVQ